MTDRARVLPGAEAFRFDGGPIGIMLQHGFSGCPASMRPFGEWLHARGVTVVAPRLPGHGTSWEDLETTSWHDWEREAEAALLDLAARCSTVVPVGLSMGASMVLHLSARHPEKMAGVVAINPDLRRPELVLAPAVRFVMRTSKGVANDIKKPGQDEMAYDRIPLRAAGQLGAMYRTVEKELGAVRAPLLLFTSPEDHVVKKGASRFVFDHVGSPRKERVMLTNSYHVATLDFDAETIFERTLAFATELAAGSAGGGGGPSGT
jgi:carboxylesterase